MKRLGFGRGGAAIVVAVLLCFTGCGVGKRTGKEEQVIRVVRNVGGREGFRRHWEAWKAAFERDHPGWRMELVNIGDASATGFYQTRIATGDLPEVIQTWALTRSLADHGHLLPIPESYFERFGVPLPTPYKGKRYASMGGLQLIGIAVNRQQWASVGISSPPESWDAFLEGLGKLKAAGHKPMTFGGKEWTAAMPLAQALHTCLYDYCDDTLSPGPSWTQRRNAGEVRFATDPTARKIMQHMVHLLTTYTGKGVLSDGYNESKSEFYQGKSATWIMGCWIGGDLEPSKVQIDVAYWPIPSVIGRKPVFVTGAHLQTGWALTTSARGPKREKALAVLEAFYDPAGYQAWLNAEAMLATAKKVEGVTGPQSDWPAAKAFVADMKKNLERYGVTRGWCRALDDMPPDIMDDAHMRVMQDILTGERDVDKLLDRLDKAWDAGLKSK